MKRILNKSRWLALAVLLLAGGCVTGPLRSRLVGPAKSATVEWTKGSPYWFVPFMGTWGVVADIGLVAGDTAVKTPLNLFVAPFSRECNIIVAFSHFK